MSVAKSFIWVTDKESADFAAASAFSLPSIPTWLGIQQRFRTLLRSTHSTRMCFTVGGHNLWILPCYIPLNPWHGISLHSPCRKFVRWQFPPSMPLQAIYAVCNNYLIRLYTRPRHSIFARITHSFIIQYTTTTVQCLTFTNSIIYQ